MAKTNQTNRQIIDAIVSKYPNINGQSSELAYKLLTEEGFAEISNFNQQFLSDFFSLLIRVWLQVVNISHAKDPLEENGFGEYYDQPWGGVVQRLSIDSVKPVSPGWKGLKDGDSPDPFVVRKPTVNERFYAQNFDYASLLTMPDEFQYKQILISSYGLDEMMAGFMEGLRNGYTIQKYTMKLECIGATLDSTSNTLSSTQQVQTLLTDALTSEELVDFILKVRNIIETMTFAPQTGAFNAAGFKSTQDKGRLKLLLRMGIMSAIQVNVLSSAFNMDQLNLGVDVIPVPNFGGLQPTNSEGATLYPVYNSLGVNIGYSTTEGSSTVEVEEAEVVWVDPYEDVVAILADKGLVFESRQNPYKVEPIRNPRGLYTNYWASSPNNAIHFDRFYNEVVFYSAPAATE